MTAEPLRLFYEGGLLLYFVKGFVSLAAVMLCGLFYFLCLAVTLRAVLTFTYVIKTDPWRQKIDFKRKGRK